ncbi:hypothetical protein BGX28_010423 [Mortierella sp. GBA30]|nr:hypothetical protein BGX28_010423 [Mortierella sp. GBA30]
MLSLICILNNQPVANRIQVDISPTKAVTALREEIISRISEVHIDATRCTLWKVSLPINSLNNEHPVSLDDLDEKKKLRPTRSLNRIFSEQPSGDAVHIIIQKPAQEPRLDPPVVINIRLRQDPQKKCQWCGNLRSLSLAEFISTIYSEFPNLPTPMNDIESPRIALYQDDNGNSPYNVKSDQHLRSVLSSLVKDHVINIILDLQTPANNILKYTVKDANALYGFSAQSDGSLADCDAFQPIERVTFDSMDHKHIPGRLIQELEIRADTCTTSPRGEEAQAFVFPFIHHAVSIHKDTLTIRYNIPIAGSHGKGHAHLLIEPKSARDHSSKVIVTVDTQEHFDDAVAQNMILLQSTLTKQATLARKRKREDDGDEVNLQSCYGIVSDAMCWQFVECKLVPSTTSLLCPVFRTTMLPIGLAYNGNEWEDGAKTVLGNIAWLLENSQRKRTKTDK